MRHEFAKSKIMSFPRHVLVGHDVLNDLGTLVDDLGIDGTLLVGTGPHTRKLAGDRTLEILRKAGFEARIVEAHGASPASVEAVRKAAQKENVGAILGVGGGSIIDVGKLAAFEVDVPFVSVPTAASHDGITSPRATIRDGPGHVSSREAQVPLAIVADTGIIAAAPHRMLAAGCADAISNRTAVLDWQLAHRLRGEEYSSFAAALAETAADIIIENAHAIKPGLEEGAWLVAKALMVSGVSMSVGGSSRPASGAEHMISHTLDELAPGVAYHGEQVGLASILTMFLHGGDWKAIRDALAAVGAPTTASKIGIPTDTLVSALTRAHENKPDRYTILGDKGLSRQAALEALRVTGVGQ
ncbi:MAG: NAD(P)-dependent glycerol-1-phosphate dehydrogenase [Thermoplasmatota archaeon]